MKINEKYLEELKKNYDYVDALINILDVYASDWKEFPLDSQEISDLVKQIELKLNLMNKNITKEEYENN